MAAAAPAVPGTLTGVPPVGDSSTFSAATISDPRSGPRVPTGRSRGAFSITGRTPWLHRPGRPTGAVSLYFSSPPQAASDLSSCVETGPGLGTSACLASKGSGANHRWTGQAEDF